MGPEALRRYRAERLLRRDFAGLRSKVLAIVRSQLRAKGVMLDASDLEACYAQAWQGLYATVLDGETVESPSGWLVTVTFRRAIDEQRAAARVGVLEGEDMGTFPGRMDARAPDLAGELDDRARLRQVFEGMRATLSKRECEAASLCYLQGLSRAQAAEQMGIGEARMRKLMEGAAGRPGVAGKVGELLAAIASGGRCEQQSSLMRAYAFGILDPDGERHALAVAHTRECPACRAHVASLRGLASVLPLPLLPPFVLAGAGAGADASRAGGSPGGVDGATAQRPVSIGLRAARRTAGGWNVGARSLTAKLAVTAIVAVGAGYGLLGSRAHGSASRGAAPSSGALAAPTQPAALPRAPFSASGRHGRASARRRPAPARARPPRSASPPRRSGSTAVGEFSPERGGRNTSLAAPVPTRVPTSQAPQPGGTREFGVE
jgi:DNA-directed RNA polymerase specialized sigma24 family protein